MGILSPLRDQLNSLLPLDVFSTLRAVAGTVENFRAFWKAELTLCQQLMVGVTVLAQYGYPLL